MPVYMSAADVMILTSSHEGSPDVIKEALACNLPIVSVDVGDVRTQIAHIDGCVLCERDDPATLAQGLTAVLTRRAPIRGREAIAHLDEAVLTDQVIDVYRRAVARFNASA